ncbi:putative N-carbamoylsarcosine amidase [Exophiala viscosa]|uniref:N-carbamoylsarcosine amidase n=1 Tax=Exophiala viscosa TaxID=2486360 RepID=A0AAN6DZC6_9EURO|nr:putative N-carbamoylsarcosine amidase [Exophiala viscosa]KAI1624198.1 putative N-carbamoylsarcosine amidase [Exophiala viscosa]
MSQTISHAAASSYSQSGFSNRMGWGSRPAIILIDVCKAYFTETSPLSLLANPAGASSPESMRKVLAAARSGGVPVVWTKVEYSRTDMSDAGLFWQKAKVLNVWLQGDSRGLAECVPGLEPQPDDVVVVKKYPSAFFGTSLASELQCLNVDTLVICGVSTSGCVRATTLDAMQYGFRPMVVGSACGDRTPEIHNSNLFDLDAKYADVVEEAEAVAKLKAGWP